MFDPIEPGGRHAAKRILAILVSLALHTLVIGALIVVPLIYFDILPAPEVLTYLASPPAPPPPPPPPPGRAAKVPHYTEEARYYAPTQIPKGIAPATPEPPSEIAAVAEEIDGGVPAGVVGGVLGGVPGGVVGGLLGSTAPPHALPAPPPPPQPPQRPHKPIHVGGALQASKLIFKVDPVYPPLAKQARISGIVLLEVTVDEGGSVTNVRVLRGHPLLVQAAVDAVRQWKYSPTILNGQPESVIADVTVNFALQGPAA
jgi:protein TonB